MLKGVLKKGQYYDSVTLMLATRELVGMPGVRDASVVMATKENLSILRQAGLLPEGLESASDNDLLIVVEAGDVPEADGAINAVDGVLANMRSKQGGGAMRMPRSLDSALQAEPGSNFALISVAGKYAAGEAGKAIDQGLHVMLFSDNIELEDELLLKQQAHGKGLLMMGPDCGTAIINGVPLGFANVVNAGNIGLVGASGTGLQEISSMISMRGAGVSQVIGTGGRDLKKEIGGIMFIDALRALERDEATEVICLVSKPPDPEVLERVVQELKKTTKPVVVLFIGTSDDIEAGPGVIIADTLEKAALTSVALSKGDDLALVSSELNDRSKTLRAQAKEIVPKLKGRYLRGLFSGGTLAAEAQLIFNKQGISVYSNAPLRSDSLLEDALVSREHSIIDMGTDEFTAGRPHPMIDFSLRNKRILEEALQEDVAVILFDVVLGFGAHKEPSKELVPVINEAKRKAPGVVFVASITGTSRDPQDYDKVLADLEQAGVIVLPSMAAAAELCSAIITLVQKQQ
ncbi:MAG: acyl-CoA synthetase FdrA [Bacteroidales bacterium]|nr:acyl-CoA synthetase FdrA [Bacteroidales bacterium]